MESPIKYAQQNKDFALGILEKVKYLNFQFSFDSLCYPTDEKVEEINSGKSDHLMRINIRHYGKNTDPGQGDNESWLTYCAGVTITEWSEKAILESIYIALIQKLRHEVSETFTFDGEYTFHEHRTENISIPK